MPENAYFQREYCLKELRWAKSANKFIQPVVDTGDKGRIGELLKMAPDDLRDLGKVDFVDLNQTDDEYLGLGVKKILRKATQQGIVLDVDTPHVSGVAHTLQSLAMWRRKGGEGSGGGVGRGGVGGGGVGKGGEGGGGIGRGGGDGENAQKSGDKAKELTVISLE